MYDIIIVGGGPGGHVAAEHAAARGKKVLVVERDELGGTCLNRGCIPTKSLLNSAKHLKHAKDSAQLGVHAESVRFELSEAMAWKNTVVEKLRAGIEFQMKKHEVTVVKGDARFASPTSIVVGSETYEARDIVVATGSVPAVPPIPGAKDNPLVVTSDGILNVEAIPARLVVIGGGVIGMEFAEFFQSVGSKVTVIEMLPEILPFMDRELVGILKRSKRGMTIETGAKVEAIEGGTVRYSKDGEAKSAEGDLVLVATGRRPDVSGLDLDKAGVKYSPKGIEVDDCLRTNVKGIWAVGDVTGRALLAHSASAMGEAAIDGILGNPRPIAWNAIPWVVYGSLEAAGVGMTEEEAKAKGLDYAKITVPARANGRFVAENGIAGNGGVKLLAEKGSGKILGIHFVDAYAGEQVWGAQRLVAAGAKVADIAGMIFPHPTVVELLRDAALQIEV